MFRQIDINWNVLYLNHAQEVDESFESTMKEYR